MQETPDREDTPDMTSELSEWRIVRRLAEQVCQRITAQGHPVFARTRRRAAVRRRLRPGQVPGKRYAFRFRANSRPRGTLMM